jgi:hypothetical protein
VYHVLQVETALRTALQLRRYDDILGPVLVYAFLALVGFYSSFYGTCSKVSLVCHVGEAHMRMCECLPLGLALLRFYKGYCKCNAYSEYVVPHHRCAATPSCCARRMPHCVSPASLLSLSPYCC